MLSFPCVHSSVYTAQWFLSALLTGCLPDMHLTELDINSTTISCPRHHSLLKCDELYLLSCGKQHTLLWDVLYSFNQCYVLSHRSRHPSDWRETIYSVVIVITNSYTFPFSDDTKLCNVGHWNCTVMCVSKEKKIVISQCYITFYILSLSVCRNLWSRSIQTSLSRH